LLLMVRSSPAQYGQPLTRWTLEALRLASHYTRVTTDGGMSQLLTRLRIRYKRARAYVHSPDEQYVDKLNSVQLCLHHTRQTHGREVTLFQDELTYYRQPTLAHAYASCGPVQALARRAYSRDTCTRIAAVLDPLDGRVVFLQRAHFGVTGLIRFYQLVCERFPEATLIHLVQDNWPLHLHPDVRAALRPQTFRFDLALPRHWPTQPSPQAQHLDLPIQLELLPTYASWTNPIEKLWRKLKQEVLHLHGWADQWGELQTRVQAFLAQYAHGSEELLRYVGLQGCRNLYSQALGLAYFGVT
jgi:hypothetical protein